MTDIVTQLRTNSECLAPSIMLAAADEIEQLRKERDEARREVCQLQAELPEDRLVFWNAARLPKDTAAKRGWDCFKENTDA